jgi:hypothetical protein
LSPGFSHPTLVTAYVRFTPNDSEQRLHPPYYRGCWHGVSRCFLQGYRPFSSPLTGLYDPKAFITHAASLRQAFAHCARFPTAASRRSLDRVSVPVWLIILSDQLSISGLVGLYPANYLMERELIPGRFPFHDRNSTPPSYPVLAPLSGSCPSAQGRSLTRYSPVRRYP